MTETVLLYALSTLAQTCAALAAFVGAVGLFRLQILRDQRKDVERGLRVMTDRLGTVGHDVTLVPMHEILEGIDKARLKQEAGQLVLQAVLRERCRWEAFAPHIQRSQCALIAFEVWNLIVIGAALVGFNFIAPLKGVWWVAWVFAAASVGTVIVTLYCVIVWTRRADS